VTIWQALASGQSRTARRHFSQPECLPVPRAQTRMILQFPAFAYPPTFSRSLLVRGPLKRPMDRPD
jgi:hypothetical protein